MRPPPSVETWREIHSKEITYGEGCFESCDSYCCCNRHPEMRFKAIPSNRQSLPLIAGEFDFLLHENVLQPGMEKNVRVLKIELEDAPEARIMMGTCSEGGICRPSAYRPLFCKLYPFIPVPADDGTIDRFESGSVFDLMFEHAGRPSPCILYGDNPERSKGIAADTFSFIFREPYFQFYFRAYAAVADLFRAGLRRQIPDASEMPFRDYVTRFEIMYMTGRLIESRELGSSLSELYRQISERNGRFAL